MALGIFQLNLFTITWFQNLHGKCSQTLPQWTVQLGNGQESSCGYRYFADKMCLIDDKAGTVAQTF